VILVTLRAVASHFPKYLQALLIPRLRRLLHGRPWMVAQPLGKSAQVLLIHRVVDVDVVLNPLLHGGPIRSAEEVVVSRIAQQSSDPVLGAETVQVGRLDLSLFVLSLVAVTAAAVLAEQFRSLRLRIAAQQVDASFLGNASPCERDRPVSQLVCV